MRTGFVFVTCLVLAFGSSAQQRDSVVLAPVNVYALPEEKFLAGSSVQFLDSALKSNENARHLGEVLSIQFPVYFRNYGNGMLSGISMRGTSPQHTAVLWNGININSFSLGQADFSILPAVAVDEIRVHEGAGSARYGSGAFGGTVLLNTNSSSTNKIGLTQEAGSFGRYFCSLNGGAILGRISFNTRLYDLNARNNFLIPGTSERQQHAGFRQSGIVQDMTYRWSSARQVSVHYWFHDADRKIQTSIGQFNGQDTQQDRNHRLVLNFQNRGRLGLTTVYGAYVYDLIEYDGSKGIVKRLISGARHESLVLNSVRLQMGAEWNHIKGEIPNYDKGVAREDRYDFTASVQKDIGRKLSIAVNLRQPVVTGFHAPFLPYFGADYFLVRGERNSLKLRGSVSKNYRIPTLNDRYWQNAGNVNLLPETSRAAEAGVVAKVNRFEFSGTLFTQHVDQWIQWVPRDGTNYTPQNIKKVVAEGAEVKINARFVIGKLSVVPQAAYQLTHSVTTDAPANQAYTIGKQLIYTPRHTASAFVQFVREKYSMLITGRYSGTRFTDFGNSGAYALNPYVTADVSASRFWNLKEHRFDVQVSVRNILNANYQLYSGYALPGRNYNFRLSYQLNFNAIQK